MKYLALLMICYSQFVQSEDFKKEKGQVELQVGAGYAYNYIGSYEDGTLRDTDSNTTYTDYDNEIELDSALSIMARLTRFEDDHFFYFGEFEYISATKVDRIKNDISDYEPDDTQITISVFSAGVGYLWEKFSVYGGINFPLIEIKDNSSDPYEFETKGNIGLSLGLEFRASNKHSFGLDVKTLYGDIEAEYDKYDIDYGDGNLGKGSVFYRYSFGYVFK